MHGDTVKAGALGNNGTLNVGGGSIDATTTIKLYAGGSNGSVNFTDNVTLSGNSLKIIAADAVTIFNGKVVTVLGPGPASVFTNLPNYSGFGGNGSTTGTFGGNGALLPQPLPSHRVLTMSEQNGSNHSSEPEQVVPAAASELNNLLQIVSGTVAMLENIWEGAPGSERYFDMLRQSVDRAAKVTARLVQHVGGTEKKIHVIPPLTERTVPPAPARSPLQVSHRILVVDDEPMTLMLLNQILSQAGHTVFTAQSGFEALDYFRKEPGRFALILLDLSMPLMDGEETFNHFRAIDPNVVVLLNTGFIENRRLDRMMANGLAGFLRRPYRADEVVTQIQSVLEKVKKIGSNTAPDSLAASS